MKMPIYTEVLGWMMMTGVVALLVALATTVDPVYAGSLPVVQ